jgi:anaerobic selenocysteine-containing dehydrogenase/Fe-S-cluster-containing dehydrogenase component
MDNHQSNSIESKNQALSGGSSSGFEPPRHWIGPEELEASYWGDAKVKEKRGQEFFEKPVELIDAIDKVDKGGLARRDFLTIMGASMALSTMACARRPVHKIIPYVIKPEEITLGVSNYYATTCGECNTGCGVVTRNREGRPIKLEGNTDHPLNKGTLCARGQASLLNLYDPDRLRAPVMRNRPSSGSQEVSWADADNAIVAKLKAVAAAGGRVRVLSGPVNSESTLRLIREFLSAFRAGEHVEWEPLAHDDLAEAQALSYGSAVIPQYHFDQARMVVSLGADFLGTWLSPIEHARDWHQMRKLDAKAGANQKFSKLVVFEPNFTITGGSADERYPVRSGDELKIALAIAYELLVTQKRSSLANDGAITATLAGYKPEAVAQEIGLEGGAAKIRQVAQDLWDNRGKSLVVGGGTASKTSSALALQVAVNLLNSALENEGVTVDGTNGATAYRASFSALNKLVGEMKNGQVDVLVMYRTNPLYGSPRNALAIQGAMSKVPLVISIADREDETGLLADYVLPDHHYLENWGDSTPRKGVHGLQQPAIAPIYSTRAFQDTLLTWIKAAGLNVPALAKSSADWHDYVMGNWRESVYRQAGSTASFEQFWEGTLRAGVLNLSSGGRASVRSFRSGSFGQVPRYAPMADQGGKLVLALYPKISMADGRSANNAWLQEMPDPISSMTWDNYLNVAPSTAKKLGLENDDVVEINNGEVSAELPVHIQPGMHPGAVSAAVGYGRRAAGKVGTEAGVDVFPFVKVEGSHLAFSGQPVTVRKTGKFYRLASTQWHTVTENRPIINDITLTDFVKNPAMSNHTDPELRMENVPSIWPEHVYKGHRWGMAIDLTSCIGCGACVIGCQAENNIPVVGRDQVRNSRQMHWIRIDRYYAGTPESPEVVFQPMLCQHCENAPCETVCPVLATVHDDEGLNIQVYNRCVGTRYCQNNCPYKVRRFNFFDHWKSYEGSMNMVWNPDVTVRSRGILEKFTFCVQRIRDGKDKAKDNGDKVFDGQIKTACQQTCPTDAIAFGDLNDPESRVAKLREDPRAFRVLETLNTKPVISYMTKVRNKQGTSAHGTEGAAPGAAHSGGEHHV